jgi:Protein of unknown function (DUF3892)
VGTGTHDGYYDQRLTVEQVYNAIDAGHSFHTGSRTGRDYAVVAKSSCANCGRPTLRSHADGDWNNNLDDYAAVTSRSRSSDRIAWGVSAQARAQCRDGTRSQPRLQCSWP